MAMSGGAQAAMKCQELDPRPGISEVYASADGNCIAGLSPPCFLSNIC